jgi:hypothetical protein
VNQLFNLAGRHIRIALGVLDEEFDALAFFRSSEDSHPKLNAVQDFLTVNGKRTAQRQQAAQNPFSDRELFGNPVQDASTPVYPGLVVRGPDQGHSRLSGAVQIAGFECEGGCPVIDRRQVFRSGSGFSHLFQ